MAAPDANLVFSQPRLTGSPTALVFGDDGAVVAYPVVTADISVTLAGSVSVTALLVQPLKADASVTLDGTATVVALATFPIRAEVTVTLSGSTTVTAAAIYDNRVTPWLDQRAASPHQTALADFIQRGSGWGISLPQRKSRDQRWQTAQQAGDAAALPSDAALPMRQRTDAPWQRAVQSVAQSSVPHQKGIPHIVPRAAPYQAANQFGKQAASAMQTGVFHARHYADTWQWAAAKVRDLTGRSGASLRMRGVQQVSSPWQMAGQARNGKSVWPLPQPAGPTVYPRDGHLLFECPPLVGLPLHLVFGAQACYSDLAPGAPLYILPARFYMTAHSIYAERLPDLAEVPVFDATVSADAGSYCWTLQANGPASLFELLAPVGGLPVQLRITMDGIPWVFAVDSLNRSSSFGKAGVSISGRSVTALIGAPYLRAVTRDNAGGSMLAQQLALSALQYTGVALDWGLTDWLVPAGAWSHQGTALDAVQAIAQAAGGYLQSHRSAATLLTRHPYSQRIGDNPGAPWGWMTGPADVELAPDSIITDGTERHDGPDINAVYVSGTTQGVLAQVKRTGTAADKLASMVTDPLITHADAARQRGLAVLGAAGAKYNVRLELPVLTGANQPGVLDVGQLVQVNATIPWRGRVRAVSINAKRPSLRQTVTLERHLETV